MAVFAAAISAVGTAEAHFGGYLDVVLDIKDYQRTPYVGYDLVRITVDVENLEFYNMSRIFFALGDGESAYGESTSDEIRARGGDVLENDCPGGNTWNPVVVPAGETAEARTCFMLEKYIEPDGLLVSDGSVHVQMRGDLDDLRDHGSIACEHQAIHGSVRDEHGHPCPAQVVPFDDESAYCDRHPETCNVDNVQPIGPEPVSLLHAIYFNATGTLALVFDGPVVASHPGRIDLIPDLDTFIGNGTASNLGDAELRTADGERRSPILAFGFGEELRRAVAESPDGLVLMVHPRAIYAAEGFVDYTKPNGYAPVLVTDIAVVR